MKRIIYYEMKKDIELCENAQQDKKGSEKLYNRLVVKYKNYDKEFDKDLMTMGKTCALGDEFDYRNELLNLKTKLEFYLKNDPVEFEIKSEKDKLEDSIMKCRIILENDNISEPDVKQFYMDIISTLQPIIPTIGDGCYSYIPTMKLFDTNIGVITIEHNVKLILEKAESYYRLNYMNTKKENPSLSSDYLIKYKINLLLSHFIDASEKLCNRKRDRQDFNLKDEYDLQDLMHSYLTLLFNDVRVEEWTPSVGGGAVRQDFLLKEEKIVIETKYTRDSMTDKTLGEELIVDIEKYQSHPDCEKIYFIIYDREHKIRSYKSIISDLERMHNNVKVWFLR